MAAIANCDAVRNPDSSLATSAMQQHQSSMAANRARCLARVRLPVIFSNSFF
jgi:hypothetical protein